MFKKHPFLSILSKMLRKKNDETLKQLRMKKNEWGLYAAKSLLIEEARKHS